MDLDGTKTAMSARRVIADAKEAAGGSAELNEIHAIAADHHLLESQGTAAPGRASIG